MPAHTTTVGMERKLTAILSADVVGYSRLMEADEVTTLHTLTAYRAGIDSSIAQYRGRIVGAAGDSVLAEFASAVDATQCAVEIQQTLKGKNGDLPPERKMEFRIGLNVGDVMIEGEQIYGDGVNVAARLQGLADVGGIFLSGTVYDQIENKLMLNYEYLGEQEVKNISKPVRVYRLRVEESSSQDSASQKAKVKNQKAKVESKVGSARRLRTVLAALGILVAVGIATFLLFSPLRTQDSALSTQAPQALALPAKPSIVVLPFDNMSKDPDQDYFSNGITEVLTSDLSRISSLFVIARNTAFTYKGQAAQARAEAVEVLRINPKFSLEVHKERMPIKDPVVLELHIAALRKAGLK